MLRKIIITGDILRPCPVSGKPTQAQNINWFSNLISCFIRLVAPQIPLEILVWGAGEKSFPTPEFYGAEHLTANIDGWCKIYNRDQLSPKAESILEQWFSNSLVIGIELPDLLKHYFSRNSISYIDFNLHSIRYADDLMFSLDTNIDGLEGDLLDYYVDTRLFAALAAIHRATLSRLSLVGVKENSCLLVGQTEYDKVLIEKGRFVTMEDYEQKIADLKKKYSAVYYKPHPYCVDKSLKYKLARRFGLDLVDENVYRYLSCNEIDSVLSISSSVVHEARFFGKDTFLFKKDHFFQDMALSERFHSTGFWEIILMKFFPVESTSDFILPIRANRLRKSLGRYWGYNYLDYQIIEEELRGGKAGNLMGLRSYLPLTWRQKISTMMKSIIKQ